jgi:hypothetical protein
VEPYTLNRRVFLFASFAASLRTTAAAPSRLETLSDWLRADRAARLSGLQSCLERIGAMETTIHAWVQVLPQEATGNGTLSGDCNLLEAYFWLVCRTTALRALSLLNFR